jgi:prolyl oligopeptidase
MKIFKYIVVILTCWLLRFSSAAQVDVMHLKSDVADTIFGQIVPDPYRWMEDLNSDSLKQWLKQQQSLANQEEQKFKSRFYNVKDDINKYSAFSTHMWSKEGAWYFNTGGSLNSGLHSPVLYCRKNPGDADEVAFDPNPLNIGKDIYSVSGWSLSGDNKWLAVSLSKSGSDWCRIQIRDMNSFKNLDDKITRVKFSNIVWWREGFFYMRFNKPADKQEKTAALTGQAMYYHKLGDDQDSDQVIMTVPDEINDVLHFKKVGNGRFMVVNRLQKIGGKMYNVVVYKDLQGDLFDEWQVLASSPAKDDIGYDVITAVDSGFLIMTNYNAPHNRVLRYEMDGTNKVSEVIPEKREVLLAVSNVFNQLAACYFGRGEYTIAMFDYAGTIINRIDFPPGTAVHGFRGEPYDSVAVFYENSFYSPQVAYLYHFKERKISLLEPTQVRYDAGKYATRVVVYHSKDGTEVPMYLTCKKGLKITGANPVLLYGYGGFGIPMTPFYNYSNILLFDNGGILAVPMIRGGGELGSKWHLDGARLNKQNSFDDFIAAAEYLEDSGYTNKNRIAIMGGSNGGLLVGAVLTQRPELFHIAVAEMGAFDMVRFNKFTVGRFWSSEYGSPDNPAEFQNLYSYSPLHHLHSGIDYPAALFIAARNDDRVPPFHTYKFLASLQEKTTGNNPHILYFEDEAGHHGYTDYFNRNSLDAFKLAFIFTEMHLPLDLY